MGYIEEREDAYDVEIERDSGKRTKARAVIEDGVISENVDYILVSYETDIKDNDRVYITDPRLSGTYQQPFIVCKVEDLPDKHVGAKLVKIRLLSVVMEKYPFGSVEKSKK